MQYFVVLKCHHEKCHNEIIMQKRFLYTVMMCRIGLALLVYIEQREKVIEIPPRI